MSDSGPSLTREILDRARLGDEAAAGELTTHLYAELRRLADGYLALLAKVGHDPFDARLQAPQPDKVWRLLWAALSGRY